MSDNYHVTNRGNTDFMEQCENMYGENSALKMLKIPEKCHFSHTNNDGDTAFMIVCANGKPHLALKMLDNPNMCKLDHINKQSQSALLIACINDEKNIAMKIISLYPTKCGKLSMIDKEYDRTIFMIMCENRWYDIIHIMFDIEKKYRLKCNIDYKNKNDQWVLCTLIHNNNIRDHLEDILSSAHKSTCGFNMYTTNINNNTILMLACELKDDSIALTLAKDQGYSNEHSLTQKNNKGETALILSTKTGKERVVSAIIQMDKTKSCINEKDNNGMSAFLYAIQTQRFRIADELFPRVNKQNLQDILNRNTPLTRYDFSWMEKIKNRVLNM